MNEHALNRRWKGLPAIFLVTMLTAVVTYLPALRSDFTMDDIYRQNDLAQNIYFDKALGDRWIFRPVTYALFGAEHAANNLILGPEAPAQDSRRAVLPHAVSLLCHALTSGLVALLTAQCLSGKKGRDLGALAAGLLFATHPVHTENAALIWTRGDVLATLFLLWCLLCGLLALEKRKNSWLAASGLLFSAALFSKEVAITGLLLLPLCLWTLPEEFREPEKTPYPKRLLWVVFLAAAVLFLAIRALRTEGSGFSLPPDLWLAFKQLLSAFGFYFRKLFIPWPTTPLIPTLPGGLHTLAALSGCALALLLCLREVRRGDRIFLFCFLWFVVASLPMIVVVLRVYVLTIVAERYLYLPSVSVCIAGGALSARFFDVHPKKTLAALGAVLAVFAVSSWKTSAAWPDDMAFMTYMTRQEVSSRHSMPLSVLGWYHLQKGQGEDAERCFQEALAPDVIPVPIFQALADRGLGVLALLRARQALRLGDEPTAFSLMQKAEMHYENAQRKNPDDPLYRDILDTIRSRRLLWQIDMPVPGESLNERHKRLEKMITPPSSG